MLILPKFIYCTKKNNKSTTFLNVAIWPPNSKLFGWTAGVPTGNGILVASLLKLYDSVKINTFSATCFDRVKLSLLQTFDYCALGPALGAKVGAGFNKRINKVYPLLNSKYSLEVLH